MVGTVGGWDPMAHLEELVGTPLEREITERRRVRHEFARRDAEQLRPGIVDYFAEADRLGLKRAIVSSASRGRGSTGISCGSSRRSAGTRSSPPTATPRARSRAPTSISRRSSGSASPADEAIAFEDSPNGVRAAQAAGIFVRRGSERGHARRSGSTRPTSCSTRSPTLPPASCSRASPRLRAAARRVASAPARTTTQSGARSATAPRPRRHRRVARRRRASARARTSR